MMRKGVPPSDRARIYIARLSEDAEAVRALSLLAIGLALLGCGGSTASPPQSAPLSSETAAEPPPAETTARADTTAQADTTARADTPADTSARTETPTDTPRDQRAAEADVLTARPCARVDIGLDLRALPHPPSEGSINMFVLSQIEKLRERAPASANVRMMHTPGVGMMSAFFEAEDVARAISVCTRTTRAYLDHAPRLPISMEPAAQVTTGCRACE